MSRGIALLVLALIACSQEPHSSSTSPTSPPVTYDSLRQRPMALPTVISDGLCPVSRPAPASKAPKGSFVPNGFGEGPVYLTGQGGPGWYSDQEVRLIVDPAYPDIVLIRGKQLNGSQGMPLAAVPPAPSPEIQIPSGHSPSGRQWAGRILMSEPGCFGLQIDGSSFEEGIVFEVQPGTAPILPA